MKNLLFLSFLEIEYTKNTANNSAKFHSLQANLSLQSILRAPKVHTQAPTQAQAAASPHSPSVSTSSDSPSSSSYYLENSYDLTPQLNSDSDSHKDLFTEKDLFDTLNSDQLSLSSFLTSSSSASSCQASSLSSSSSLSPSLIASFKALQTNLSKQDPPQTTPTKNVRFSLLNTDILRKEYKTTSQNNANKNNNNTNDDDNRHKEKKAKMKKSKNKQASAVAQQPVTSVCMKSDSKASEVNAKACKKVDFMEFNLNSLKSNYNFLISNNSNTSFNNKKKAIPIQINQESALGN